MLHVGLDLSRARLDVCLVDDAGEVVAQTAAPPDADGLRHLAENVPRQAIRMLWCVDTVAWTAPWDVVSGSAR